MEKLEDAVVGILDDALDWGVVGRIMAVLGGREVGRGEEGQG